MKRYLDEQRRKLGKLFAVLAAGVLILFPGASKADDLCGLSLGLYVAQGAPTGLQYPMGDPIKLVLIIKNVSGFTVKTELGFSQLDLYQSLILTDPAGKKYKYNQATRALDMPPPFFLNGKVAIPAEALPEDWGRTVTVDDLTELFPMMKTNPGWYTVEAQQPVLRFGLTVQDSSLGLLGIDGHQDQCQGVINSNRLNLYIFPLIGAQLQVEVLDKTSGAAVGINQVPVKVFQGVIPDSGLKDRWATGEAVLVGTTNPQGVAVWGTGGDCKLKSDYTAVAYHNNSYKAAGFPNTADGWAEGCGGTIAREIVYSEFPSLSNFSILAINSVWLMGGSIVRTGNVGVLNARQGLWFDSGVEISVGPGARAADGVNIYGDTIKLWRHASVDNVYYNDLQNAGTIRGEAVKPLTLPLPLNLPSLPEITPGRTKVTVKDRSTKTLPPGEYGDVKVGKHATLKLTGGVYHFRNLDLEERSSFVCLAQAEIRIKERMYPGFNAYIGPLKTSTALKAKDVKFYVAGTNGHIGHLHSVPKAAEVGPWNTVKANIYVPNGTLWIDSGSDVTGSFIAKGVAIGVGAKVSLDSAS